MALQSISKTAFRPSRDPSVCFTVPSPNPSLCFSAPLASGHSYSSFSDLRLHSPEDGSQSEGNWVPTDRDGPDGNNLEVVHDDPFKTSNDSDRFDQEDFADEKSWVPVDASSLEASIISDATDFGSRPPPLPSRPRSATDPHMLLSPCVLPSPLLPMGTPEDLDVHIVDVEDSETIERAPLLGNAAPTGQSRYTPLLFSDRLSNRKAPPSSLRLSPMSTDWEAMVSFDTFDWKDRGDGAVIKTRTEHLNMIRSIGEKARLRTAIRVPLPLGSDEDLWEYYDRPISSLLWSRACLGTEGLQDAFNGVMSPFGDFQELNLRPKGRSKVQCQ